MIDPSLRTVSPVQTWCVGEESRSDGSTENMDAPFGGKFEGFEKRLIPVK
jgi:hypothetical protein